MKLFLSFITTLILLSFNVSLYAETNLPYTQEGMIDDLNLETNMIVIGDIAFSVSPHVEINNTSGGKSIGVEYLNTNTPVGYNTNGDTVSEVWILDRAPIDRSVDDE